MMPDVRSEQPTSTTWHQSAGRIGFILSLLGLTGMLLVGHSGPLFNGVGMRMTFLCLPGFFISGLGLLSAPRRLAKWGMCLGIIGSMFLPTFCVSIFMRTHP